ncbi:GIY-YIG nuclease family protein [Aspergillus mulundensis]|uniref:Bacteriophage T5 Orf172 DNA-binding domain-containing protein n=1 Tax=Aspergillus mulundensis TaxID=1810919 RepID=A0A3D8S5I3_9EURO|nr:hypothetical protein DSM5745_05106 [Aspergillus mulundensis]RDW81549.1 hypothetical protein DSM5745_05106 [Aspergillus mulundensis]
MALPDDLLATPLSLGHAPSATLHDAVRTPVSLATATAVSSGRNDEDPPETPSPCARKVARRVQKKRQERTSPNRRLIQEMRRKNKSPIFVAALAKGLSGEAVAEDNGPVHKSDGELHITVEAVESENEDTNEQHGSEQQPIIIETDSDSDAVDTLSPTHEDSEEFVPAQFQSFTPRTHTVHAIFGDIREAMTKSYKKSTGHGYILFDRHSESPFFKIGKSADVKRRQKNHQRECKLATWSIISKPARAIRTPMRLERLAQAELRNLSYIPSCACGVAHQEYFWGEKELGLDALAFWAVWLQGKQEGEESEPYDCNEQLKPFWADRLDQFQDRINDYFRCDDPFARRATTKRPRARHAFEQGGRSSRHQQQPTNSTTPAGWASPLDARDKSCKASTASG